MRTTLTLIALALFPGCGQIDNGLNPAAPLPGQIGENVVTEEHAADNTAELEDDIEPDDTNSSNTPDEIDDNEQNLDDGCWLGIRPIPWIDQEVGVKSVPIFRLISDKEMTVSPGQDVVIEIGISSYKGCGDIDLNWLFFSLTDLSENSHEWLKEVSDAEVESFLVDTTAVDTEIDPNAARNLDWCGSCQQLFYNWSDTPGIVGSSNMETQLVNANEEKVFEFIWTASDYAPIGSEFTISLSELDWTDVTTGEKISFEHDAREITKTTITIGY